jgi:SAM-dependent MidA family methyltransferase
VRGLLIANEVLDALPVHRLLFRGGEIREIHVAWEGRPREVLGPVSCPEILEELRRAGCVPREGQEMEVCLAAVRFLREAARRLERGYLLVLDYGHTAPEIYSPRHHRGTLLAYHRHATSERYLERAGRQDLTAHVNFTSVLAAARNAGLETAGPVSQARFLLSLGILERLPSCGEAFRWEEFAERRAARDLVMPGGMGETHQVLVLATPGLGVALSGLRDPEEWTGRRPDDPAPAQADGGR